MQRSIVLAAVLAIGSGEAHADLGPYPARDACTYKHAGDACWAPIGGTCVPDMSRPVEVRWLLCEARIPDGPVTSRIVLGLFAGLAVAAGGVWLAIRKRPA